MLNFLKDHKKVHPNFQDNQFEYSIFHHHVVYNKVDLYSHKYLDLHLK